MESFIKEEILAEIGSLFLSNRCGIVNKVIENSVGYIKLGMSVHCYPLRTSELKEIILEAKKAYIYLLEK